MPMDTSDWTKEDWGLYRYYQSKAWDEQREEAARLFEDEEDEELDYRSGIYNRVKHRIQSSICKLLHYLQRLCKC